MVSGRGVGAAFARGRAPVIMLLLVLGTAFLLRRDNSSSNPPKIASRVNPAEARAAFGRLPMSFEKNQGQSDSSVKFLARGNGYGLYLTSREAALVFGGGQKGQTSTAVEMKFAGANLDAQVAGSDRLPGHSNYFIGNDPSRWLRNVPQFGRVAYREVYPGIDLAFYGKEGRLEYDFNVTPGADPDQIQLDLTGTDKLQVASNGDLVLAKNGRELRFQAPHVYQNSAAGIQNVQGEFILRGNDRVSFKVGDYDRSRTLVIDPVLVFGSYLGGSLAESCGVIVNGSQASPVAHCPAIAVDGSQRVYVAGSTLSSDFPVPSGSSPALNGGADVFLVRFNPTGTALDYTTYLGGSGTEYPTGVAVDSGLNVYIAGTTDSPDFPTTTATAFQSSATGIHAFVTKFDSSGSARLYSTYLAGNGTDVASGMALDSLGSVYVMGMTTSTNITGGFPASVGALQTCPGQTTSGTCPTPPNSQFFFSKVDPSQVGSLSLPYSTYIGGSTPANASLMGGAVAVDSSFNVYLAGGTGFTNMPIVNAFQSANGGGRDAWVAKLNAPANNTQQYTPAYETYLGSGATEDAYGVATDGTNTFVTGSASASGITTVPAAVASGTGFPQAFAGGASDAFVAKFGVPTTTGTTQGSVPLSYFTYLGGGADDAGLSIVADSNQNAYVTGWTDSGNFHITATLTPGGPRDAFVSRILTSGTSTNSGSTGTSSSIILGGSGTDTGTSVALDPALNVYVAGDTNSGNFPSPSSLAAGGGTDAFVAKLGPKVGLTFTCSGTGCPGTNPTVSPNPVGVGSQATFDYAIYNLGDPVTGVVFTVNFNSNVTLGSVSGATCPSSSGGGTVVCTISGTVGTTATNTTSTHIRIPVTAPSTASSITSSATLSVIGTGFQVSSAPQTVAVNDFSVSIAQPSAATVIAGGVATYTAVVTPLTNPINNSIGFPGSVSLSCASGLPSGASCSFTNNPIPNMSNGPQSRPFEITTTARVTTPARLFHLGGPTYALWMPIFGAGLLGAGISRKRRVLLGVFFAVVLGIALLQMGCGGGSSSSTTTGTPTGTYTVIVNATGGATRSTTLQLTVE